MRKKKSKGTGKINATRIVIDGIQFRSLLEGYCYNKLKENKIKADYEKHVFTLLDGFTFKGKKIQPMTYTPDFVGDDFVIECKGQANDAFPLRWKMFKYLLYRTESRYDIYLPHTPKEVDDVIKTILEKRNVITEESKKVRNRRYKQLLSFLV